MINVDMTIREMVSLASNPSCDGDLYERIIKALEEATGNIKKLVACNGVAYSSLISAYWDNKFAAIKCVRLATGWGLKDAREWVEGFQYNSKTMFTGPLDPAVADKLCNELKLMGVSCWVTNA